MSRSVEESNRRMLRARDPMDRTFPEPLCFPRLARIAEASEAHFIRTFRATFGESPHRYLQRRRVERAMFLIRSSDREVTEICFDVGFNSELSANQETLRREALLVYEPMATIGEDQTAAFDRSDLKPTRISSLRNFGCSQPAKWPPLGSLL